MKNGKTGKNTQAKKVKTKDEAENKMKGQTT